MKKFFVQLLFMCKKNATLQMRYWKSTVTQAVLGPIVVLLILFGIQTSVSFLQEKLILNPVPYDLGPMPVCSRTYRSSKPCITMMFAPASDQKVQDIMKAFVELNNLKTTLEATTDLPSNNLDVIGVPSAEFIYDFAEKQPNVTAYAVSFDISPTSYNAATTNYRYQLWYNSSLTARNYPIAGAPPFLPGILEPINDAMISVVRALDEAIIAVASQSGTTESLLNVQLKDLPQVTDTSVLKCPRNPDGVFSALGPVFLFVPMMVVFFSTVNTIVSEKEIYLKESMEMIGLLPIVFWLSHYLSGALLVLINALVTIFVGYAFGFTLFRNASLGVLFVVYLMYGLSSLAMAMFVSSLCGKVRTAIGFGFFLVIIGAIYIGLGTVATYVWYVDPALDSLFIGWVVLMFFPFFNYNKFIRDTFAYTSKAVGRVGTSCSVIDGSNFGWDEVTKPVKFKKGPFDPADPSFVPSPSQSLWLLFMNLVIFAIGAWYFDKVLPNENGYSEHPFFFLMPSFYGFKDPKWMQSKPRTEEIPSVCKPSPDEDPDVAEERRETDAADPEDFGLRIQGMHKVYHGGLKGLRFWFRSLFNLPVADMINDRGFSKIAVNELSLNVNKGDLIALLGSNGAGKTSTMKILYGSSPPTLGNAWIFGMNIRTQMRDIRKILGVCPQFDVLFPDLSAREHVELFCGIKGIPSVEAAKVMEERLKHMKLWNVRDQRANTYSGGMKRRLSVVLSTLGDPQCVFLDEPTTGMDPVNKRYVWSFIENFKKGRVIILTTHSMEEADVLGDKIAIMSKGRLKGVGKAVRLKNKFGTGYRVSLIIPRARDVPAVKKMVTNVCAEAVLEEEEYVGASALKKVAGEIEKTVASGVTPSSPIEDSQTARLAYSMQTINLVKKVVRFLEEDQKSHSQNGTTSLISGWGMSQTTLEDVFTSLER